MKRQDILKYFITIIIFISPKSGLFMNYYFVSLLPKKPLKRTV